MKQDISIIRGTSKAFRIRVTDANGELLALAAGEKIIFGVKKRPEHEECLIKKAVTEITDGVCTVQIDPADTEALAFGNYSYDVGLLSGDDYFNIIPCSQFHICKNITERGDGS